MSLGPAVHYAQDHPPFDDFLYGNMSADKYNFLSFLYGLPFFHQLIDWRMDARASQEYLDRYGMSWEDIHDFRKLSSFGSQARLVGSAYRMVSKNVEDLYE